MIKKIAVTGGGTGGHVFPGLAVIEKIQSNYPDKYSVFWIGSSKGMEKPIIARFGIPFYGIPSGKLRRYFSVKNFVDLFRIAAGFIKALYLLKVLKPDILFSKGGFVSVPPVFAARLLKIPVFSHESDINPGLATRINSRFSEKIFVGYEKTLKYFGEKASGRVMVTGNPVRSAVYQGDRTRGLEILGCSGGKKIVFVLGGSQGAAQINNLLKQDLDKLLEHCFIVHQMGKLMFKESDKENYRTFDFITDQFSHILAASNLVISRSGAGALWENAVAGKPALLVPLGTGSSRGDQIDNALFFKEAGAAEIYSGEKSPHQSFAEEVISLISNDKKLGRMGLAAGKIAEGCAAADIAGIIHNRIEQME